MFRGAFYTENEDDKIKRFIDESFEYLDFVKDTEKNITKKKKMEKLYAQAKEIKETIFEK